MQKIGGAFLLLLLCSLHGVDVAITIDDHPMADTSFFGAYERTERLLSACENHNCKAAFFCVGEYCKKNQTSVDAVNRRGHFLANHSMTHPHVSTLSLSEFEEEVKGTQALLEPHSQMRKYFRYPALDYGNQERLGGSREKGVAVLTLLKDLGYVDGYVSINTYDWYLNTKLQEALRGKKRIDYTKLKNFYLSCMRQWCEHYIEFYENQLSITPVQTLLLHANDLNALYLDDILCMIRQLGWNIVSPEKAFQDTSWREKFIADPTKLSIPPPFPSCQDIDRQLQELSIFG